MNIAGLNELDIMDCDIQNKYLTELCIVHIWAIAVPKLGEDEGTLMLIKIALYVLKS